MPPATIVGAEPPCHFQPEPRVTVTAAVRLTIFVHEVFADPLLTVTFDPVTHESLLVSEIVVSVPVVSYPASAPREPVTFTFPEMSGISVFFAYSLVACCSVQYRISGLKKEAMPDIPVQRKITRLL